MSNTAGAILSIDLDVIKSNYLRLKQELGGKDCAAVVKADAYGLGVGPVARALYDAGARTFFIAQLDEGIALRKLMGDVEIHVLVGLLKGAEDVYLEHNLVPVLNTIEQVKNWNNRGVCDVQMDTGMTRLGISMSQIDQIPADLDVDILMSHFACADDPAHEMNAIQMANFAKATKVLAHRRASLANSSGIFMTPDCHYDLGRPGCALYGINPTPDKPNPMGNPVRLQGKIVQIHEIDTQQYVGYGATQRLENGQKLATIALGYADGYLRSLSSQGVVYIDDVACPVVGRVSMDLISIDVSKVTEEKCKEGQLVDVIGPNNPPDDLAEWAGTIGYEILTGLGARYHRVYKG